MTEVWLEFEMEELRVKKGKRDKREMVKIRKNKNKRKREEGERDK